MSPVRVAVLSDDGLLCEHFVRIAGAHASLQVVGQDQRAVLPPPLRAAHPDVLLVDGRLEGALDLCKVLKNEAGPAVIFMAVRDDDDWARWALEAGARGILAKNARADHIVKAVLVVHEGQIWARRRVLEESLERLANASAARLASETILKLRLSSRQMEVFRQAAAGLSNKEVAARLAISQATVKAHLTRIFQKLGLRRRSELVATYHGLVPPAPNRTSPRNSRRSA
jgi:DNA-binding NarL/FixJ family response regulator